VTNAGCDKVALDMVRVIERKRRPDELVVTTDEDTGDAQDRERCTAADALTVIANRNDEVVLDTVGVIGRKRQRDELVGATDEEKDILDQIVKHDSPVWSSLQPRPLLHE
jgi:hypothetical protein